MNHDELQPESAPPPVMAEGLDSAPEPSSSDAPPTAPARRRRARAAGTDAASAPETPPADKPARASRRRKAAAVAEEAASSTPPITETPPQAAPPPATPQEAAPVRQSRRRSVAKQPAAAKVAPPEPRVPEPIPIVESIADAEPPAAAPEKPNRRRGGRKTKTETPVPDPVAEVVAAPEPETPAFVEAVTTPEKPTRRRAPRRGKAATTPDVPASAEAVAITPLPEVTEFPVTEAAPVAETPVVEPERARRRRRSRRRGEETTETPAEALAAPEALAETPAVETERSRRNRRGGRNRRGQAEPTTETISGVEPIALPPVKSEPPIDTSVGAHLLMRNGLPEIRINGVFYPPVLFFGNVEESEAQQKVISETRRAAAAGVHLHSTLVELPLPLTESSDALDKFDARIRPLLTADPDGYVMPRLVFIPARGWKREYPTDIATYADGPGSDASLTSERFWQEAERSLAMLIAHVREQEWGKRIFGYHLERGEWFQPADSGYDRSIANRDAFRDWLREKYRHDLVALRAAWYDGDVQFHTAEIPPVITKPNPQRAFYETRRERRYIDFNAFTSESTAKRLTTLANTAKKAANHQALVSVCYGYTFEFGHGFSGHLALDMLLDSSHIDLVCGPPSYRDRKPGGAALFPVPVDTFPLHKKLFLSEDDTKTYLAPAQQDPEDFNPRLGDRFATEQAQARSIGKALTQGTAIGWMDLWGEGWLDEGNLWERIGAFTSLYGAALQQQTAPRVPEVVALIDEKSLLHIQRGETFFRKISNGLRDVLQRAGVSYGTYLQSDILNANFPLGAKLYLFLTPYRLTPPLRAAIQEKLQRDGKTLAFLFAPGSCEARPTIGGAMEEVAGGSVGIALRQQEWNSEIGSRIVEPHHPITERLPGREIGTRERLNPSFFVDDPEATVLAEYQGSCLPSIAVRDFGTWKSVFVGEPTLPLELLRGICRYAGVHLWNNGDDIFSAGNGWLMLHATRDGHRVIRLPLPSALYDVTDRRLIADEAREYRFFLRNGNTRLFYVGNMEKMRALNLPNLPAPGTKRPSLPLDISTPALPTAMEMEPEPERPSLRADLETLEAVLSLDVSALDLDIEPDAEVEPPAARTLSDAPGLPLSIFGEDDEFLANGRRRRRRGGRGRGRRRFGSISEAKEGETPAPETGDSAPEPPPPPFSESWNEGGEF